MQTKRKYFVYKEMQSLRIFSVQFFCRKKITSSDYRVFYYYRIFPIHTFYIDFQKCTVHIFIPLEMYDHTMIFQHIVRSRGFPDVSFFEHANRLNFKGNKKIGLNNWIRCPQILFCMQTFPNFVFHKVYKQTKQKMMQTFLFWCSEKLYMGFIGKELCRKYKLMT